LLERAKTEGIEVRENLCHPSEDRWAEVAVVPFAGGVALFSSDVTGHRRAEEGLRESEEHFDSLARSIPSVLLRYEPDMRVSYLSPAAERFTGVPSEEFIGRTSREAGVPPDLCELWETAIGRVFECGEMEELEFELPDPQGVARIFQLIFAPEFTPDRTVAHVLGISTEVTDRRLAEEAMRVRERAYRVMAEENERLYRQQLAIAESLQQALLNIPSEIGRLRVGHLYRSATEAARVGGDFYDVFEVKGGLVCVLVGDVAGHGIQAARTATLVKDVVHAFTHQSVRTHEVLRRTNALLVEKDLPGFVSLFLGIMDGETGSFHYSSAGHPETLLRRASGEIEALGSGSAPLGVFPEASWRPGAVDLEPGDLMLLYTDGVIEARRNGELFGERRLYRLLKRKRISVERLPHLIVDQVLAFSGGALQDDIAVLALTLTEGAEGAKPGPSFKQEKLVGQ
jgi:PAS domain S-box-containing protein